MVEHCCRQFWWHGHIVLKVGVDVAHQDGQLA